MRLEISLFRFDYKHDYLPYYTKHFLKISNELTLLDILNTINKEEKFSFENSSSSVLCINGIYTQVSILIRDLMLENGRDLKIEPLSIRRVYKDLLINDDDFQDKFKILENFMPNEVLPSFEYQKIKDLYQSYKIYFYASNTLNIEKNYIGDSILLLADYLINTYPKAENFILKQLKEQKISSHYHTNLKSRVYNLNKNIQDSIKRIQNKLKILNSDEAEITIKNKIDFSKKLDINNINYDFKDFKIAYYSSNTKNEDTLNLLNQLKAKKLNLSSMNNDLALNTFNINKTFTYKLAAEVILDAYDQAADFLLVDKEEYFYLFDNNISFLEKVSNREIRLPVVYVNELILLVEGKHKEVKISLDKHIIKIDLLNKES